MWDPVFVGFPYLWDFRDYMCLFTTAVTMFSKAHGVSCSHRRNFRSSEHFKQLFSSLSNEISPVLVTCVLGNDL